MARNKFVSSSISRDFFTKYLLLVATIIVAILFGLAERRFFKINNLFDIIRAASLIGIMGIGLTIVQAAGEFDFSIGAQASFSGVVFAMLMARKDIGSIWIGLLIMVCLSVGMGLLNTLFVIKIKMPAFVATLGFSTVLTGLAKYMTGGGIYFSLGWPSNFTTIGQKFLFGVIPNLAFCFLIVIFLAWLLMEKTRTGRYIYAVGLNPTASHHVGINVNRQKAISFIICSVLCGFCGFAQASMLKSVTPEMGGGNLLPAISTVMLGATFLRPGVFNILGTAIGALLLAIISNGLTMIGASFFMKDVIQGIILLCSVGVIALIRKGGLPSVGI